MQQLFLNFPNNENYLVEDFYVSSANNKAIEFIKSWPNWGESRYSKILILYGESGCGKTHLSHIWKSLTNAKFLNQDTYRELYYIDKCFVLEDIENLEQQTLLHLINVMQEKQQYLLLTSSVHPSKIKLNLLDLQSRLIAIPSIEISSPDSELLRAVLLKHLSDRNLQINMVAVDYIIPRIERSFTKLLRFVNKLDSASKISKKPITIPLIKEIL